MKKHLLMIALQLASHGADAYYTNDTMQRHHHHEYDPLISHFVHQPTGVALTFSVTTAATIIGERWLHKRHNKLADTFIVGDTANSASAAVFTRQHRKTSKNATTSTH